MPPESNIQLLMPGAYSTRTATVFLVFNRPDVTARVFERIREARPPILLIVCDGPRAEKSGEATKVQAVRDLIDRGVDWPCKVFRNYSDVNLGCRQRVASGLNWAFSIVEEAIILEDDCLPENSFFWYCDEMLERYRNDSQVMHISGYSFLDSKSDRQSYWFSRHIWIWGWATWRRAWSLYDSDIDNWDTHQKEFNASFSSNWEKAYWLPVLRASIGKQASTWDHAWIFTCRALNGLGIFPASNLIRNLGFGHDATHTSAELNRLPMTTRALASPLCHPKNKRVNRLRDERVTRVYSNESLSVISNIKSCFRVWRNRK